MILVGTLVTLASVSFAVLLLAAVGLLRLRHRHTSFADPYCHRLERDLVMAIGMTMSIWCATALALLVNPSLGDTPLLPGSGGYSIARGTIMLAFGHCVGWGGFLVRRGLWWERAR